MEYCLEFAKEFNVASLFTYVRELFPSIANTNHRLCPRLLFLRQDTESKNPKMHSFSKLILLLIKVGPASLRVSYSHSQSLFVQI